MTKIKNIISTKLVSQLTHAAVVETAADSILPLNLVPRSIGRHGE